MSDLQWTVVKLQQMLAERNATECDASKRDAEHALCRIANESLVHDLTRVMDERDRLQRECVDLHSALDMSCEREARAHLRGQEAMRERVAQWLLQRGDTVWADAIRALEVER